MRSEATPPPAKGTTFGVIAASLQKPFPCLPRNALHCPTATTGLTLGAVSIIRCPTSLVCNVAAGGFVVCHMAVQVLHIVVVDHYLECCKPKELLLYQLFSCIGNE